MNENEKVLTAIKTISEYCKLHKCNDCQFGYKDKHCMLAFRPSGWKIKEEIMTEQEIKIKQVDVEIVNELLFDISESIFEGFEALFVTMNKYKDSLNKDKLSGLKYDIMKQKYDILKSCINTHYTY